jgi:capsid protein
MPSGWNWGINPLQEVQAARESMRSGITTLADECAWHGFDWKTQLRKMAKINRECKRLGVTIEADAAIGTISRKGDAPAITDAQDAALNPATTTENP